MQFLDISKIKLILKITVSSADERISLKQMVRIFWVSTKSGD